MFARRAHALLQVERFDSVIEGAPPRLKVAGLARARAEMRCLEGAALHTGFLAGRLESLRRHALSLPSLTIFLDHRWSISALVSEPTWAGRRNGDNLLRHGLHRVIALLRFRQKRGLVHHVAVGVE